MAVQFVNFAVQGRIDGGTVAARWQYSLLIWRYGVEAMGWQYGLSMWQYVGDMFCRWGGGSVF